MTPRRLSAFQPWSEPLGGRRSCAWSRERLTERSVAVNNQRRIVEKDDLAVEELAYALRQADWRA